MIQRRAASGSWCAFVSCFFLLLLAITYPSRATAAESAAEWNELIFVSGEDTATGITTLGNKVYVCGSNEDNGINTGILYSADFGHTIVIEAPWGPSFNSVQETANAMTTFNGSLYVAGQMEMSPTNNDMYCIQLSGFGSETGLITWDGGMNETAYDVDFDDAGNYLLAGINGLGQAIVVKLAPNGTALWNWTMPGSDIACVLDVACDGIYTVVTGLTSTGSTKHAFVARLGENGASLWNRTWASIGWSQGLAVSPDAIFISGHVQWNTYPYNTGFVACYDKAGTLVWNHTTSDMNTISAATGVTLDGRYLYVTGSTGNHNGLSVLVQKLDVNGSTIWRRGYDLGRNGIQGGSAIVASDDALYLTGNFIDALADYRSNGGAFIDTAETSDAFIAKLTKDYVEYPLFPPLGLVLIVISIVTAIGIILILMKLRRAESKDEIIYRANPEGSFDGSSR